MRKSIKLYAMILALPVIAIMSSCEPKALTEKDVFAQEDQLAQALANENPQGYRIYGLNEFLAEFMTEAGDFPDSLYRERATGTNGIFTFSIDTIPTDTIGIYIRGRVTTDDFAGNFYKSLVIQQVTDWATGASIPQQNLRISVDLGSGGGMYQTGQEIIIRCNGLAVGRYSNQPQLCVPSYNNNIYAMNATEKVGWAPGRIPSGRFRGATRMIGSPDQSKLVYDELTLTDLYAEIAKKPTKVSQLPDWLKKVREMDGRLVVIKDVHFNGFYGTGTADSCNTQHPDSSENANVFAPTTNNIGYPQSRILEDGTTPKANTIMCQCSEYAKFAYYYLPGASKAGISDCKNWKGSVTGILGWYYDKPIELPSLKGTEWSVTPRGIPGIGNFPDIQMKKGEEVWVPKEYDPKDY